MNPVVFFTLSATLLALSSCAGPAFNRDWEKAVAEYESGAADSPVAGPWTGSWLSDMNQHTGKLRCLVSPAEDSENQYQFRYRATWKNFLSGGFNTGFPVRPDGKGGYAFDGEQDLGQFGTFEHRGNIDGDVFSSSYKSSLGDYGTFKMARP